MPVGVSMIEAKPEIVMQVSLTLHPWELPEGPGKRFCMFIWEQNSSLCGCCLFKVARGSDSGTTVAESTIEELRLLFAKWGTPVQINLTVCFPSF